MRSRRNRTCSLTGKNRKGNCAQMFNFIEHDNVQGEMMCNREYPDAVHVYNIIQGGGLRARHLPHTLNEQII